MLILITIPITPLLFYTGYAQQTLEIPDTAYLKPYNLYSTWYSDLSIQASVLASIPGRGVVAVSGSGNSSGEYFLEVLSIDSASRAIHRSRYAVSGTPTTMISDGDSGSYIAVGSDRGEVIVYNAQDMRASYIQASRYPVKRLSVGVGASGDPYLAVLDAQDYLYLYRATRGGWAEVGPRESTAVYNYTRSSVLDISGTEVVSGNLRRVDPSLLLMIYTPPLLRVSFTVYNETGYPIQNATVTASLARPRATEDLVFQSISDQNGTAFLSLPLIDPGGTLYRVNITHPEYETVNMDIELNQAMLERTLVEYRVVMRSGQGEIVPIVKGIIPSYAVLLDTSGAPESIRFGRSLLLGIEPIYVKLIRPSIIGTQWVYLGVIVGYRGDQFVAAFTYFDQDLNPVPAKTQAGFRGYVWYILPSTPQDRVWIGYDDNGRGVSVILSSGRVYYFLYNDQRGFHIAFWGIDIPGSIVAADYRNGALVTIDSYERLHINRVDPSASVECTRSGDYLGVPIGPGVGAFVGVGNSYIGTSSRIYIIDALNSIVSSKCSIDLVRVYPRVPVSDIISNYSIGVNDGYIDVYEGGNLVARGPIANGSSTLYLPRGSYSARVSSSMVEYTGTLVVRGSSIDLPGPTLYRVNLSLYYYAPESPYTVTLTRVPPGLTLYIDDRISATTTDGSLELLLEGGGHRASLVSGGVELARGEFVVNKSGRLDLVLRAYTATLNIRLGVLGARALETPTASITLRLFAEGPLLRGDLGAIRPGLPVTLPLGVYRVVATSPFFYQEEVLFGIMGQGVARHLEVLLRPREIQASLLVVDDLGSPVPNASVSIVDMASNLTILSGVTSDDGVLTIPRIFVGVYSISIEPSNQSLYTGYTGILRVDRQDLVVSINRTRQQVTLVLTDPISGSLASPVRVSIYMGDRLLYRGEPSGNVIPNLSLPHGTARIVVEPAGRGDIYTRLERDVSIAVGGGRVEVALSRRIVDYTISVVNDLGQPIQGASITIKSLENPAIEVISTTGDDGKAVIRLPYGSYEAVITAQGYNKLEQPLPTGVQSVELRLQPTLLNLLSRFTIAYIAIGMVAAIIIMARMARRYIERKASEEAI